MSTTTSWTGTTDVGDQNETGQALEVEEDWLPALRREMIPSSPMGPTPPDSRCYYDGLQVRAVGLPPSATVEVLVHRALLPVLAMGLASGDAMAAAPGEARVFTGTVELSSCDFQANPKTGGLGGVGVVPIYQNGMFVDKGWGFTVEKNHIVGGTVWVEFRFWEFEGTGNAFPAAFGTVTANDVADEEDRRFCIKEPLLDKVSKKIPIQKPRSMGPVALSVPLKLRLADPGKPVPVADAELGFGWAFTLRRKPADPAAFTFGVAVGASPETFKTTVGVTAVDGADPVPTEITRLGVAPAGFVGAKRGPYSILLMMGTEALVTSSDEASDWDYQWKPWVGIGLNIGMNAFNDKPVNK